MTRAVALAPWGDVRSVPCAHSFLPAPRRSAEIAARGGVVRFPKGKLPDQVEDFGACCARLIEATFPGPSRHAICLSAARALGCSDDTILRILEGATKSPDPRLMFAALAMFHAKTGRSFEIGGGFALRITLVEASASDREASA